MHHYYVNNTRATYQTRSYADASNNRIASDYLGFIGYQCFGNPSACNLFTDMTVGGYANKLPEEDDEFLSRITPMLSPRIVADADQYGINGELIADSAQNLCFLLFRQLMDRVPGRFDPSSNDYSLVQVAETTDEWYLPVVNGDVMECRLTMKAAVDQSLFGQTSSDAAHSVPIEDRVYLLRFVIGQAAPKDGNVVNTDLVHDSPTEHL